MENFDSATFSFFENDRFIQWVNKPDAASNAYWQEWMQKNPDGVEDLLKARQIAQALAEAQRPEADENLSREIWDRINLRIGDKENIIPPVRSAGKIRKLVTGAAAAAAFLGFIAFYFYPGSQKKMDTPSVKGVASTLLKDGLQHINTGNESRIVYLVDGSKITLQPGASVKHTAFLEKDKREIYLDGDAFFEVAKDPARPFYVYAHDIVLRVLGTSFKVTTNRSNGNITVLVKTGKVSVYKNSNRNKAEFILTPNEGVKYTAENQRIVKAVSPAELSVPDILTPKPVSFNFEETPVARIFSVLEDAYGIHIQFDEKLFSKCIITTSLNDATFEEKLKIICEAINAGYKVEKNEVMISGAGCK